VINKIKKIIGNHLLSQNDWMQSDLINHKNKIVIIEISGFKTIFKVKGDGQVEMINDSKDYDCKIKLTVNDLIGQLVNNKNGKISIEGDIELANKISQVLRKIEWDLEEDLAKYIGDIPAIQTTKALKKIKNTTKENIKTLTSSLIEYWQEENKILAKTRDVEMFNKKIDTIVEDTERVEARINNIIISKKI
jgi:ubiquinone biosynthesis protein UbiJ|tara:strand:+ start:1154 stop:1729 length:576 start_codon:yes stop_codon:yes gene_type:complete